MFVSTSQYHSLWGLLCLATTSQGILGCWFEGQKHFPSKDDWQDEQSAASLRWLAIAKTWLDHYFDGRQPSLKGLAMVEPKTPFLCSVRKTMCQIPYGQTLTYGALAKMVARDLGKTSMAAQAVAQAVAHNPLSIFVPCHRVVGARGALTGYAAGLSIKRQILEFEGIGMDDNNRVDPDHMMA